MQEANIGKSLQEAQYKMRLSTAKLAEMLGETRQAVYYTRKQKSANIHKVQQLANIFEMSLDEFVRLGIDA